MNPISLSSHYPFLQGGELRPFTLDFPFDAPNPEWKRPALLLIAGGAYACVSKREQGPIAARFLAKGFQVFLLRYLCCGDGVHHPEMLLEAACAVDYLKKHAEEFRINPKEIFALGCSAGGHLAAHLATTSGDLSSFGHGELDASLRGLGLAYPVISHLAGYEGTHRFALGLQQNEPFPAKVKELDLDERVPEDHVPTFIFATAEDDFVPVENSLRYASALSAKHIPFSLHIYPFGHHGASAGDQEIAKGFVSTPAGMDHWCEECADYFRLYCDEPF